MKNYKIFYAMKLDTLDEKIKIKLNEGWVCQGGVAISRAGEIIQAMTYSKRWWQIWK